MAVNVLIKIYFSNLQYRRSLGRLVKTEKWKVYVRGILYAKLAHDACNEVNESNAFSFHNQTVNAARD